MLQLIGHIIRISSKCDRTEINAALVDAMQDLFSPSGFAVYRCYPAQKQSIVFSCAGLRPAGQFSLLDYGEADTLTGLANRKTFDKLLPPQAMLASLAFGPGGFLMKYWRMPRTIASASLS